jgi:P27 family predicted phage terminase small subunit
MGGRGSGRIPRPAGLRIVEGRSEGRDSGGRRVPLPPPFVRDTPDKPPDLSPKASALWDEAIADLESIDRLKRSDGYALEMMCEAYATWKDCQARVRKVGRLMKRPSGVIGLNPIIGDMRAAEASYRGWACEFGLTASSEQRLSADGFPGRGTGTGEYNPFAGSQ